MKITDIYISVLHSQFSGINQSGRANIPLFFHDFNHPL